MANKLTHSIEDAFIYADGTNNSNGIFYGEGGSSIVNAFQISANEDIEVLVRNIDGRWVKDTLKEGFNRVGNIFGVKAGSDTATDLGSSSLTAGQITVWFE